MKLNVSMILTVMKSLINPPPPKRKWKRIQICKNEWKLVIKSNSILPYFFQQVFSLTDCIDGGLYGDLPLLIELVQQLFCPFHCVSYLWAL